MALTNQDFDVGRDFTGLGGSATAADHNALVNLAIPHSDGTYDGKGLVLVTKDGAPGVPTVPNADAYTKWKKYLWARIKNDGVNKTPILYFWNDDLANDATYRKWTPVMYDYEALVASITAVDSVANDAIERANAANSTANSVYNLAKQAADDASQAISDSAANAAAIDAVNVTLLDLNTSVTNANTHADEAITAANAATAAATEPRALDAIIGVPAGNRSKIVRVSETADVLEYHDKSEDVVVVTEQSVAGAPATNAAAGDNVRAFTHISNTVFAELSGGNVRIKVAGTYMFDITVHAMPRNGAWHKARLSGIAGPLYIAGTPAMSGVVSEFSSISTIRGIVALGIGDIVCVKDYFSSANGYLQLNINDGGTNNVWTNMLITKLI